MKNEQRNTDDGSQDNEEVEGRFSEEQIELLFTQILATAEKGEAPSVADADRLAFKYKCAREEVAKLEETTTIGNAEYPPALREFLTEIIGTEEKPFTVWRTEELALLTIYVRFHDLAFNIQSRVDSATMGEIRCVLASYVAGERLVEGVHIAFVREDKLGAAIKRVREIAATADFPCISRPEN